MKALKWLLGPYMLAVIAAAFLWPRPAKGFIGESSRIVFFHVPREAVDLEALRLRVTELQILVEIRCSHTGDCPVHNLDTRTLLLND